VLLTVAYLAFVVLSSPVGQVTFEDQSTTGEAVVVDSVSLSQGGYVVVRERTPDGQIVGHSRYLEPGTHEDVSVPIDRAYSDRMSLYASPHLDTDDDERFEFGGGELDGPYRESGDIVYDSATVDRRRSTGRLVPP